MAAGSVLALDIGTGTQDLVIYSPGGEVENSVQMVVPSPTVLVAGEIRRATRAGRDLALTGTLMGGGPCVRAIREHLAAGLRVTATQSAALTIHDSLDVVRGMGIGVGETPFRGACEVRLGDLQLDRLHQAFSALGVIPPQRMLVAALDHGYSPAESNRRFRFRMWERFLAGGGHLGTLLYMDEPPGELTRLRAIWETAPGTGTMDTGAAAIWGALQDPVVSRWSGEEGLVAVNVGNSHLLAALVQRGRVLGLLEHHSRMINRARVLGLIEGLREGRLTSGEVYDEGGHGAALVPGYRRGGRFGPVAVTGPLRGVLGGLGFHMAAPWGNMMLSGAFGILAAAGLLPAPEEGDGNCVPDRA